MTSLEALLAIADDETKLMALKIIGREKAALMIAKLALMGTTIQISPADASNVLEIPKSTAANRIDAIGLKGTTP